MLRATLGKTPRGIGRPQSWLLIGDLLIPVWDAENFIGPADAPSGENIDDLAAAMEARQASSDHHTETDTTSCP